MISYFELAKLFTRLSLMAFGGPVAHIAMMEDELVARRGWLTREHFLDLIAATNLLPGPNSTEVAIHVGYTLRGITGALVSGIGFIFPTFVLTFVLSVLYVSSGAIPQVDALLWGIKPVIVAIIAVAAYRLVPTALRNRALWIIFALALVAAGPLNIAEVVVMLGAGVVYAVYHMARTRVRGSAFTGLLALVPLKLDASLLAAPAALFQAAASPTLWDIFFYFLRIGAVLFGSGYVLVAYIQQDLVETFGWISPTQLLDAIAIGQITPGPVSTAATVVGYLVGGTSGAVLATVGIFLPAFVFVILTAPLIPRMRRSPITGAFLTGVNAGVVAAILVTVIALAREALTTPDGAFSVVAFAVFAAALVALIRFKLNATWVILAGALVGLIAG